MESNIVVAYTREGITKSMQKRTADYFRRFFFSEKLKKAIRQLYNISEELQGGDHMDNKDIGSIIITLLNAAIEIVKIYTNSKDQ